MTVAPVQDGKPVSTAMAVCSTLTTLIVQRHGASQRLRYMHRRERPLSAQRSDNKWTEGEVFRRGLMPVSDYDHTFLRAPLPRIVTGTWENETSKGIAVDSACLCIIADQITFLVNRDGISTNFMVEYTNVPCV